MNTSVDNYFIEGCGRCPLGGTPGCKVHTWTSELELLRKIVLDCRLTEASKWGALCYTFQNKNMLMVSGDYHVWFLMVEAFCKARPLPLRNVIIPRALKEYCCISFFKGPLLRDDNKLLVKSGPNSQAVRLFRFKNTNEITRIKDDIRAYIFESIEVEKAGLSVIFNKNPEPIPEELEAKFEEDPFLKNAFEALTPGRQRGYVLHFSQPKQEKARLSRIEKCVPMILAGIGLHDQYTSMIKSNSRQQGM